VYLPKPLYEARPYIFIVFGFAIGIFGNSAIFTILGGLALLNGGIHIGERHYARTHPQK